MWGLILTIDRRAFTSLPWTWDFNKVTDSPPRDPKSPKYKNPHVCEHCGTLSCVKWQKGSA